MKNLDVIIIGAGTSGLSARKEIAKKTSNYIVIQDGPIGTTCARVGCMPSKALIQVANDFHQSKVLAIKGLLKGEATRPDHEQIMKHVRALRDRFVKGVVDGMDDWKDKIVEGRASFVDPHTLIVNDKLFSAKKIVIATGSSPVIPPDWKPYQKFLIDTDGFFELETLPERILVVGLGVIGLELGQALAKLGVQVTAVNRNKKIGGLSDPKIQDYVAEKLQKDFPIHFGDVKFTGPTDGQKISVEINGETLTFDRVLASVGRSPNLKNLHLEKALVTLDEKGLPKYSPNNLSLDEASHIFLAGDVNGHRPVLHEAADDGKIAGFNSVNQKHCFKRRIYLGITFSEPNIAIVGESFKKLSEKGEDFVTGHVSFENQGRSIVKLQEQGLLHVYVRKSDKKIIGAELQAPDGEHLAHLLAWAISLEMTVTEALGMPFYHPVVEEGLRTALRNASKQLPHEDHELFYCDDPPIR